MNDSHENESTRPDEDADAVLPESVITRLRRRETLDPEFESSVMARVRREGAHRYPRAATGWWRRARVIRVSPLGGLALAAAFAGLVCVGTLAAAGSLRRPASTPARTTGPVHVVRFALEAPDARTVSIVGGFNGWARQATPLRETSVPGVWTVSVPLPPGRHEYAFIVDGDRWVPDPLAARITDEFETVSSVVTVDRTDAM